MRETKSPAPLSTRRAHFIETLLQAILHSAEDGNLTKIRQMIDTLYVLGTMPVTQADLAQFAWAFNRPTTDGAYYVLDARRLDWLRAEGVAHTVLRSFDFGMTEVALPDPQAEAAFRARWCQGKALLG